jgi:Sec-independent protein translocase protein TatA
MNKRLGLLSLIVVVVVLLVILGGESTVGKQ